jgi:glyoxylase-like metal-dependent hydrolase (beta-lactamase superfamily II)
MVLKTPRPPDLPAGITVLERGWLSANGILFQGQQGTALIDSGYCSHSSQSVALVEQALGSRPLDLLLNTHLHSDHCGGNHALQHRYPNVLTFIPPGLAEQVRQWDPVALAYTTTGQHCPRFQMDGLLHPGDQLDLADAAWQVHAAPGHDPHSIIFFEPSSCTLISADALWENGFGVVFQELEGARAFDEVAATLDLIEQLQPRLIIPGHGPVFTNVATALATARRRLDGFASDPLKHANYGAKVLLKFKLLELQRMPVADVASWASATPYLLIVHQRWFGHVQLAEWISQLMNDLVRSGAARREGEWLLNA